MSDRTIRIATRRSPLALWQAENVREQLLSHHPGLQVELVRIATQADVMKDTPLAKIGGKALFVKELEVAMLRDEADIAVHSMKDVPMAFPEGLHLPVICTREDPTDAFVSNRHPGVEELPEGAHVGTSSLRRQCQLRDARPDLVIDWLRGNVGTRLGKLDDGKFDAIVLATAGLLRLELGDRITQRLPPSLCLPAGGQGAVGIECRDDDSEVIELLRPLHDADTADRVLAERAVNQHLEGGCQVPIACYAELEGEALVLRGLVGEVDGSRLLRAETRGPRGNAQALGVEVGEALLEQGAGRILAELQAQEEQSGA